MKIAVLLLAVFVGDPTAGRRLPIDGDVIEMWVPPRTDLGMAGAWLRLTMRDGRFIVGNGPGFVPARVVMHKRTMWRAIRSDR